MKLKRFVIGVIVLVVIIAGAYVVLNHSDGSPGTAPVVAGAPAGATPLARGEYLTKSADCVACHTVPGSSGQDFAGGVAFKLPFGTIYSSNITADKETGIGDWSDDQFVRAVREGVRNDGAHLYPAFPYTSYTALSRDDVLAIKAYLFSLPPVKLAAKSNDLSFPFNQRWAMGFWNAAFFKSQRFQADASKPPQWNTGAYLGTALGHCAECHTPRNFGFGLKHSEALAGETLQGWRAYNITSDPQHGIGGWSEQELTEFLRTGHAAGRGLASGPMGEAIEHSLQYLDPADTAALVSWLRSVPPSTGKDPIDIEHQPPRAVGASATAPPASELAGHDPGLKLFESACASCHQWNGQGQETAYASLLGTRGVNDPQGHNVVQVLLAGVDMQVAGQHVLMPSFAKGYSDTELAALANYVIGHYGDKQGQVTPKQVAESRQ